jgi:hypothetical protein
MNSELIVGVDQYCQSFLTKNYLIKKFQDRFSERIMRRKTFFLSIIVLFVLLTLPLIVQAEASSTMWTQTYGGDGWDSVESVIQTSDGGYALAGRTKSFSSGGYEFWLIKTDSLGNMEWNRTYGYGLALSVVQTADGGYALAGVDRLVKTDSEGNMEWNQTYGEGRVNCMVQTSDGGYALAGTTAVVVVSSADFWFAKTDALGNLQWERNYGGPEREAAASVIQTSDSGYALFGTTDSGVGEGDFLLVKTDSAGDVEWSKTYGSQDKDEGHAVVQTSDGGYALAGLMWNRSGGDSGLVKTDSAGNMQWKRNYGEGTARAMELTSDGGYIIACSSLVKIDSEDNIQWNQPYGNANSVIQTSDGGYALAGTNSIIIDNDLAGYYAWLIKTDTEGNIPEFPAWTILPLVVATTLIVIYFKKKLFGSSQHYSLTKKELKSSLSRRRIDHTEDFFHVFPQG